MLASIFSIIQLVLKLIGLWDQFLSWSDAKRVADGQAKTQARNDAVDASKKAETDDDIFKSQTDITNNMP